MSDDRIEVIFGAQIAALLSGLGEATAAVKESTEAMSGAFEGMAAIVDVALGPIVAIGAVLEGGEIFKEAIEKTAEFGKQLEITSQKTGMAVTELSALQYAADLSDVTTEQLTIGLQRLARAMEETERGTGPANAAFNALGIATMDAGDHLRPMHDVLLDLAEKFRGMEDGAGKTAIAMDLFGRSGAQLIPLLNQGRDGITELEEKARSLGVTMGTEGVETAGRYTDQMKEFHQVINSLERTIALKIMPSLTTLSRWIETLARHFDDLKIAAEAPFLPLLALSNIFDRIRGKDTGLGDKFFEDLEKANAMFSGKTPAPSIADPKVLLQMEEWQEELNKRKQLALDNNEDLKQVELDFWKAKLAIAKEGSKEYVEVHTKIIALEEELAKEATAAQKKQAKETAKEWVETFNAIPKAFEAATRDIGKSVFSMRDLFREVFFDIVKMSAAAGAAMLRDHVANELAKKDVTVESVLARVAIETWGAIQTVARSSWAALIAIGNYAAETIAATWSSISAIPIIGPFLAPALAIAAGAGVIALAGSVRSASGGYDVPPGINPMTQLHAQEMVLPADIANRIRGMTGGGGDTYHIHALDAASFRDFAKRNPEGFGDGVAAAVAANHAGLNRALRNRV